MTSDMSVLPTSNYDVTIAARVAANNIEKGLEPLSTLEAQAFASWLHAVYLSIFLHVDDDQPVSTLLCRCIERMADQGRTVLTTSTLSAVANLAHSVMDGFYLRATAYPSLNSQALFALAARLPLGPLTQALVAWVDIAYGDAPVTRMEALPYFRINANGSLCHKSMPVLDGFRRSDVGASWQMLPAYWRVLHVVSRTVLPYKGSAHQILSEVVSVSALPLDPYYNQTLSFPNYIAILEDYNRLFATAPCVGRVETMMNRLLQPWMGKPIRGMRYAQNWLQWMQSMTLDGDVFYTTSIYTSTFMRLVGSAPLKIRMVSLEALDADADPNPPSPPANPNPDPDQPKKTPDKDNTSSPDDDNNSDNTTPSDTDTTTDANMPPEGSDKNNSIGNITLEKDSDPGRAHLYRRAVLALDYVLGRDPHIEVDQTVRESLHLWCRDWLWLASVTQTESLIKAWGLQKTLGLLGK